MKQVLLKDLGNTAITIWAADTVGLGDRVRWNGSSWFVSAVYGTRFLEGHRIGPTEARRREKPNEGPLERYN